MQKIIYILLLVPTIIITKDDKQVSSTMFSVDYAYQFPEFDLKDRFGNNSSIEFHKKIKMIYWFLCLEMDIWKWHKGRQYFWINRWKYGDIININGQIPIIRLFERGGQFHINFGKNILEKFKTNQG